MLFQDIWFVVQQPKETNPTFMPSVSSKIHAIIDCELKPAVDIVKIKLIFKKKTKT